MTPRPKSRRNANGQGGVYRRTDGRWEGKFFVDTPDGRRKRVSVYGDTEREALDELNKLRDQQRRGIPVATTTLTVADYMSYWLEHIAEPSIRRTTYATYEGDVRLHIIPGIGRRKLKSLRAAHIREWLNNLRTTCQCCAHKRDASRTTPRCCAKPNPECCQRLPVSKLHPAYPPSPARSIAGRRRRGPPQSKRGQTRPAPGDRRAQGAQLQPRRSTALPQSRGNSSPVCTLGPSRSRWGYVGGRRSVWHGQTSTSTRVD